MVCTGKRPQVSAMLSLVLLMGVENNNSSCSILFIFLWCAFRWVLTVVTIGLENTSNQLNIKHVSLRGPQEIIHVTEDPLRSYVDLLFSFSLRLAQHTAPQLNDNLHPYCNSTG